MKRWPIKPLGEIAIVQMGQSPPGESYNTIGVGLPFFQGKAEFGEEYPNPIKWCSSPSRIAEAGDILLSVRAPVGPTNFATERCCIGRGLAAIRGKSDQSNQRYIRYYLTRFEVDIAARGVGSTFAAINRSDIEGLRLPIPPLAEQERIVKLLDEADELRKLRANADERTAKLIPALFNEMFGDPATNPRKWENVVLGSVIFSAKDGPHVSPHYAETGVPFLSTRNIKHGRVIWEDLKFLSEHEAEKQWKKCKPEKGDVLYTKGGTTGIAAAVTFDRPIAVWVHIALLKTDHSKVDALWLENMLNTSFCYRQSQELTHGIANRDLGLTRMVNIKMYLPPLPLQRAFAARVTEIRALEAEQSARRRRLDDLFQSMLHRAFNGEL
jgi:type I restriction enzyme, S subunit